MIAIGVYPGATGAMVMLFDDKIVHTVVDNKKFDTRSMYDLGKTLQYFCQHKFIVAIEEQQYMPKGGRRQGGRSAFTLGKGFGFWLGYFQGVDIRYDIAILTPRPQQWQRHFFGSGTVISEPKERSIRAARAKLPDLDLVPQGCRVPSHGRADAGLIALWALAQGQAMAPKE